MIMNNRMLLIRLLLGWFAILTAPVLKSQSPEPIVVQAASEPRTAAAPVTVSNDASSDAVGDAIKSLQDLKATNAEILKRQQAALEQLEEIQKNADQLKIFANRG